MTVQITREKGSECLKKRNGVNVKKQINEKQYAAIALLSIPKRDGLTYEEVADRVGVSRQTLAAWRKDDAFSKALKDEIVRTTLDDLPEVMKSLAGHIIRDGNAALLRTLLQAHGMLTEKHEIETNSNGPVDIDAIRERMKTQIEQFRKGENA